MAKVDKVLLVDDDEISSFLHHMLMQGAGVAEEFEHISDPKMALKYMQEYYSNQSTNNHRCPDLVFIDVVMPGLDGFEFLEELDKLSDVDHSRFLIIMLTISDNPKFKEKADSLGNKIAAFLNKPLSDEDIQRILNLVPEEC